ncbi:hypothetical protein, partial [Pseudomonas sp. FEN]
GPRGTALGPAGATDPVCRGCHERFRQRVVPGRAGAGGQPADGANGRLDASAWTHAQGRFAPPRRQPPGPPRWPGAVAAGHARGQPRRQRNRGFPVWRRGPPARSATRPVRHRRCCRAGTLGVDAGAAEQQSPLHFMAAFLQRQRSHPAAARLSVAGQCQRANRRPTARHGCTGHGLQQRRRGPLGQQRAVERQPRIGQFPGRLRRLSGHPERHDLARLGRLLVDRHWLVAAADPGKPSMSEL